jgi:hypothetical protein
MLMTQQITENSTGYYTLEQSGLLYLPFECPTGEQVIFTAAHSNFFKNQNWSVRFWISVKPDGEAINQEPQAIKAFVNPLKLPVHFGVFDLTFFTRPKNSQVAWLAPATPGVTYYLNVKIFENRPNGFYLVKHISPIE